MIDFRYHLVSLVAVFIALAVGIVLGAGPLREGISETLDDEVAQLRTERAELRAELEAANGRAGAKDEAVELTGARAVSGTLTGSRVAVVLLPGADRDQSAQVEDRIEDAGGDVALVVELDDDWIRSESGDEDTIDTVIEELGQGLAVPGDGDPTLGGVLAATLAGADREGNLGAWLAAGDRLEDEGFLDLAWQEDRDVRVTDRRAPQAVLLVSGGLGTLAQDPEDERAVAELEARTDLVSGLVDLQVPTVVAAAGTEDDALEIGGGQDPLVQAVRGDGQLRGAASTVDDLEGSSGRLAATYALAWELQDQSGQYGLGEGSEAPVPAPPPLRVANDPTPGEAEATEPVPDEAELTEAPSEEDPAVTTAP